MKPWNVLALALLFTLGFTLGNEASLFAHQIKRSRLLPHTPPPQSRKTTSQQGFVDAIIREINQAEGLLTVETATAIMHVRLTPKEARDFQVGEITQVQMLGADTEVM